MDGQHVVRLIFPGTRGNVLIDCGQDWLGRLARFHLAAILVTHGHEDHAGGLKRGAAWPVEHSLLAPTVGYRIASVETQLGWCAAAGVHRAVFTHCGSGIVRGDPRQAAAWLGAAAREHGVAARIASDGFTMRLGS